MTIEAIEQPGPPLPAHVQHHNPNPTGGRLVAWADAAHSAGQLGAALARTAFVPKDFRGKPEECAAAILFGDEIGLTPMQSLQSIYVVNGRPGLYAKSMLAIVLAAGHDVVTTVKSDAKVTVRGRRRGSETWVEETWTTERARRAGYTTNKKYESDPQAMLLARAQSDVCRQIAPDALAGLAYSVEELELAEQAPTTKVTRSKPQPGTTAQRRIAAPAGPAVPEEPSFDEPEPGAIAQKANDIAEAIDAQATPGITADQSRRLHAMLKGAGLDEREAGLAYCSWNLGREVASTKELTRDEASAVMESLLAETTEPGDEPVMAGRADQ